MKIRDHWNRIVRKSTSSASSSGRSTDGSGACSTSPPPTPPPGAYLVVPGSHPAKQPHATTTTITPIPAVPTPPTDTYAAALAAALATSSTRPPLDKHDSSSRLTSRITTWRDNIMAHSTTYFPHGGADGMMGHRSRRTAPPRRGVRRSMIRPPARHPSERPLTEQNMRHQQMLGTFTMKFGRTRGDGEEGGEDEEIDWCVRSSFEGVSPCTSRPASLELRRVAGVA